VGGCSGIINNVIRNNVFSNLYNGNGAPGGIVTISEATNDVQIDGLYVYNNTLSAKTTGGTYNGIDLGGMGSGANTKNIFIRNNIFQNFQSNPIVRQSGGSQSNVQITNNDFWNNSNNGVSWTGATLANNQTVNPGFVSATDFHLQPTSLLIDKGFTPLTLPGYVQPAPFTGSAPDLGAFETGSGNQPPVANAGADQSITLPANSVSLSGTGSDSDGTIASYAWVKVSGPAGELIGSPSSATTSVSNLSQGTYVFRLTVTDNLGATGTDTVQVTVNSGVPNVPPVSNAGADQSIALPTASITLSGSGSDSDGTVTSFAWSKVSGPAATIVSPSSSTTQVNGLVVGTYVFQLTVTDNDGATGTDTVQVVVSSAPNVPPVANAGADKVVILPANSVSLGGSGSDSDGTIVSYSWSKVSGPAATITSPASANTTVTGLTAGVYVFQLTVTDNSGATGADTVQVTVNNATNQDSTKVITYVYSGNAAAIAAGLTAGMLYRLSNGNVKVVY
jgi:ribosomal protein L14